MFSQELLDGQVRSVLDDWRLPMVDLWAVYPGGPMASAKARALIEFVEHLLSMPRQPAMVCA